MAMPSAPSASEKRPWSSSNSQQPHASSSAFSSAFSSARMATRKSSLNDLALGGWSGTSSAASSVPQPTLYTDDPDTLTSLPQIPDTHPQMAGYESIVHTGARPHARHSFSNIFGSLEDFRQAAGRKLRSRKSLTHKNASAIQEEEEDVSDTKHSAAAWLRKRGSLSRIYRRPSELAMVAERRAQPSVFVDTRQSMLLPKAKEHASLSPAGGEGARAAAAMARLTDKTKDLELSPSLSPVPGLSIRRMSSISSDNESGIEFGSPRISDDTLIPESVVSRQDPAGLPTEIFTKVLTFLDSETLMHAELVSKRWNDIARSPHVWKFAFNREFTEPARTASGSDEEVPAGGFGLGIKHGYQPWKRMWKIRKQLDQRWKDGHAAAIYLVGHHDSVYCVQFDEKKIITGSRDWTIRVWDANTLRCTHVLGVPKDVNTIHQPLNARKKQGKQPTESLIPAGPHDPPVQVKSEERHTGSVLCIDYDKEIMVTGSSDSTVIVWSVADGTYEPLKQLRAHSMGVLDVRLNDKYIVACSKDTTVSVWDRKTLSLLRVLNGHRGPVNAVQLRGNFVVSASGDGVAKMWNLATGLCVKEFHPPGDENVGRLRGLACVEFTHDARTIFAGGNDKKVYQFDTASGNMVRTFKGHEGLVRSLHFDAANGRIVTGSYDHAVWTYDFETGEPLCHFKNWTTSWMLSAKADYRRIVAASQDGKAIVMDFGHSLSGIDLLRGVSYGAWTTHFVPFTA